MNRPSYGSQVPVRPAPARAPPPPIPKTAAPLSPPRCAQATLSRTEFDMWEKNGDKFQTP